MPVIRYASLNQIKKKASISISQNNIEEASCLINSDYETLCIKHKDIFAENNESDITHPTFSSFHKAKDSWRKQQIRLKKRLLESTMIFDDKNATGKPDATITHPVAEISTHQEPSTPGLNINLCKPSPISTPITLDNTHQTRTPNTIQRPMKLFSSNDLTVSTLSGSASIAPVNNQEEHFRSVMHGIIGRDDFSQVNVRHLNSALISYVNNDDMDAQYVYDLGLDVHQIKALSSALLHSGFGREYADSMKMKVYNSEEVLRNFYERNKGAQLYREWVMNRKKKEQELKSQKHEVQAYLNQVQAKLDLIQTQIQQIQGAGVMAEQNWKVVCAEGMESASAFCTNATNLKLSQRNLNPQN